MVVKENLENLLSVLRYRLPRFSSKRQNQSDAIFWRHNVVNYKTINIF